MGYYSQALSPLSGVVGRRGSSQTPNEVHILNIIDTPCYFEILIAIYSVCQRYGHESNNSQFTECPRTFADVVCFRDAPSARAVNPVTVSSGAGWLHTVLLCDATAEFNVLFQPIDVICIPERVYLWPSFHTVNSLVQMIRAIFQIRREPVLHHTCFQVVLKHNSRRQCIQRILAVSMVTNHFLYCVVFSRRHNCISFLHFKS